MFFPINTDAGFYLAIAESVNEGAVIYKDIWMRYTPWGIYFLGLSDIWTAEPAYKDYLFIVYFFNLLNIGWVYLIGRKLGWNKLISFGASIITLGLFFKYEATFIVLEPFVIFFLLVATYFSLLAARSDKLWSIVGFCVAAGFLCKQYALAILPALIYWMYKMGGWKYIWRLMGIFLIGFIVPLALTLIYYRFQADLSAPEMMSIWLSSGGYGNFDILKMLKSLGLFILLGTPVILTYPFTLFNKKPTIGLKSDGEQEFLVLLIGCMILPLFFQQYNHYFLLIIPFAVLLGGYLLNYRGTYQKWVQLFLILNILIFSVRMIRSTNRAFHDPKTTRSQQYSQAIQLNKLIPPNSEILLLSHFHQRLNYLCKFEPVLPEEFGYTFPENLSNEQLIKCLEKSQIVVTEEYDLNLHSRYAILLEKNGFKYENGIDSLQIWRKNR